MSNDLHDQIRERMNLRETDELLEIWHQNDRDEWSDTAFEVIKQILIERLGQVPIQNESFKGVDGNKDFGEDTKLDDGLEEWEVNALDDENQPEFYDTLDVITLKDKIDKTLKGVIIVYVVSGITTFSWLKSLVASYFSGDYRFNLLINLVTWILLGLGVAIQIAITYYPLKALMNILKILMEMEFRSRKIG